MRFLKVLCGIVKRTWTEQDLYDFINEYCEISSNAYISYIELHSALFTFVCYQRNKKIETLDEVHALTDDFIALHKLNKSGYRYDVDRAYGNYTYILGIKLKKFPERNKD